MKHLSKYFRSILFLLVSAALLFPAAAKADTCVQGSSQATCVGSNPSLCPLSITNCTSAAIAVQGDAKVAQSAIIGENGFTGVSAASAMGTLNFTGWQCSATACTQGAAGSLSFSNAAIAGNLSAPSITRIAGNGEELNFYGCTDLSSCTQALIGSITVSGAAFSGDVSANGGFLEAFASGNAITLTGANCGTTGCTPFAAGTITISGTAYSCPFGSQYSCVNASGTYQCSNVPCFSVSSDGFSATQPICAYDLNANGTIDFTQGEVQACVQYNGSYYCPLNTMSCSTSSSNFYCPSDAGNCPPGGTYNPATYRCESTPIVTAYTCSQSGTNYAVASECSAACQVSANCTVNAGNPPAAAVTGPQQWCQYINQISCSGSTLTFSCSSGGTVQYTVANMNCSSSLTLPAGIYVQYLSGNGQGIDVYGCSQVNGSFTNCGYAGTLATAGVTVTGSTPANSAWMDALSALPASSGGTQSAPNALATHNSAVWGSWYSIYFTGVAPQVCPLGNYPCVSGSCSSGDACTPLTGCISQYFSAGSVCAAAAAGGFGGTYVSATGYCEVPPNVSCPSLYSYDNIIDKCVANAECPGGALDTTLDLCTLVIGQANCPPGFLYSQTSNACLEGVSCPGGAVFNSLALTCQILYNPSCSSSGYSYDSANLICYAAAVCPGGGTLDTVNGVCSLPASALCPSLYSFDAGRGECELVPPCPAGSSYSSSSGLCVETATPSCPNGGTLNSSSTICQLAPFCSQGTFNSVLSECTAAIGCPSGYTYNSSLSRCEEAPPCPDGSSYNSSLQECTSSPVRNCPPGGSYNSSAALCEATATSYCSAGTLDAGNGVCYASATCPGSGTLNAGTGMCGASFSPTCAGSYTYNSSRSECELYPQCPFGAYNTSRGRCETAISSYSCPSGYSWNSTVGKCQDAPTCSAGNYNASTARCEEVATATYTCPYGGGTAPSLSACNSACVQTGSCTSSQQGPNYCVEANAGEDLNWKCTDGCSTGLAVYNCPTCPSFPVPPVGSSNCPDGPTLTFWGYYCAQYEINAGGSFCNVTDSVYSYYTTSYNCSLGGSYGSLSACTSACSQGAACTGPTYSCPGGWTLSGTVCYQAASCLAGGSLNASDGQCEAAGAPQCANGAYDGTYNVCYGAAGCPNGGSLDTSIAECVLSSGISCPSSYSWSSSLSICEASPTCSVGSYNATRARCELSISGSCASGYGYNASLGLCTAPVTNSCFIGGFTYSSSWNSCYQAVACDSGGTLDGSTSLCQIPGGTSMCPSGMTYSSGQGLCVLAPSCQPGFGFDPSTNLCEEIPGYACGLSGFTYSASIQYCEQPVQCPSGGALNAATNYCEIAPGTSSCPGGFTYNASREDCEGSPGCPGSGLYDAARARCEMPYTPACPGGFTFNGTSGFCEYSPQPLCTAGSYDSVSGMCSIPGSRYCPDGYAFDATTNTCELPPACASPGAYDSTVKLCDTSATHDCPGTYMYADYSRLCYSMPSCYEGNFDSATGACTGVPPTCPFGSQYACYPNPATNQQVCSNVACFTQGAVTSRQNTMDSSSYTNDGTVNPQTGTCSGQIYIFNGKPGQCDTAGLGTNFFNCCNQDPGSFGPIQAMCSPSDANTVAMASAGACHYIGVYCVNSWPLAGCVQSANVYCCFNSELGRIIQEQGRPQLKTFPNAFGTPQSPDCRGFTPEEFQMIDFTKVDLSEYYGNIVTQSQSTITNTMNQQIQHFYQSQ